MKREKIRMGHHTQAQIDGKRKSGVANNIKIETIENLTKETGET